jgi:hypothetical protein
LCGEYPRQSDRAGGWTIPIMQIRPKLVLTLVTFLTFIPRVHAQGIIAVQENGRRVYVNDLAAASDAVKARRPVSKRYRLVYWSQTEQKWKPVPGSATMRAARTAAAEVGQYLGMSGVPVHTFETLSSNPAAPGSQQPSVAVGSRPSVAFLPQPVRTLTASQLDAAVEAAATRHNVDPNLVRAVIKVESNFNPRAVSPKGAMGLMQLMPGTARDLAVTNPFDPEQNLDAGVRHLKGLLNNFSGDVPRSLAAYNAGAGAVTRNNGVPPYRETRDYVKRITQLYGANAPLGNLASGADIHVSRGSDGVLKISNTD